MVSLTDEEWEIIKLLLTHPKNNFVAERLIEEVDSRHCCQDAGDCIQHCKES